MKNGLAIIVSILFLSACSSNTNNDVGENAGIISGKVANYSGADAVVRVIDFDDTLGEEIEVATGTIKSDGSLNIELPVNPSSTYKLSNESCEFESFGEGSFLVARYFTIVGSGDTLIQVDSEFLTDSSLPNAELQRIYASRDTEFIGKCENEIESRSIELKLTKGWSLVKLELLSDKQSRQTVINSSAGFVWRYQDISP